MRLNIAIDEKLQMPHYTNTLSDMALTISSVCTLREYPECGVTDTELVVPSLCKILFTKILGRVVYVSYIPYGNVQYHSN